MYGDVAYIRRRKNSDIKQHHPLLVEQIAFRHLQKAKIGARSLSAFTDN
jgi:hypothetical protein